jgi:hypothetical protein
VLEGVTETERNPPDAIEMLPGVMTAVPSVKLAESTTVALGATLFTFRVKLLVMVGVGVARNVIVRSTKALARLVTLSV